MTQLFAPDDLPAELPEVVSKSNFAQHIGVHKSRVSQLIDKGMPVEPNGNIHIARAQAWCENNLDPERRRAFKDRGKSKSPQAELNRIKAERAKLDLEKARGSLVNRQAIEKLIFERAQAERDAWLGWTQRAAIEIAADTGADIATAFAVLDRLVREHLVTLASRSVEELKHD